MPVLFVMIVCVIVGFFVGISVLFWSDRQDRFNTIFFSLIFLICFGVFCWAAVGLDRALVEEDVRRRKPSEPCVPCEDPPPPPKSMWFEEEAQHRDPFPVWM